MRFNDIKDAYKKVDRAFDGQLENTFVVLTDQDRLVKIIQGQSPNDKPGKPGGCKTPRPNLKWPAESKDDEANKNKMEDKNELLSSLQ